MRTATLCFLVRGAPVHEVLLGHKKVRFGAGKYAGIGGGVEPGETIVEAAARELAEEIGVGVTAAMLEPMGTISFRFPAKPVWDQDVHIFVVFCWKGEPRESEEMRPAWFGIDALPFDRMWQDAPYWLPHVLSGQAVRQRIVFADDNETVQSMVSEDS